MLNISIQSRLQLHKPKFSYRTAQEYCHLVSKSKQRARSSSRDSPSPHRSRPTAPNPPPPQYPRSSQLLRHVLQRQKLRERSTSSKPRQTSAQNSSLSGRRGGVAVRGREGGVTRRAVCSYEQEHLLGSLEGENQQLREKIGEMRSKIERVRSGMSLQRESHQMQREMYALQVRKLRETLELQASRSSTRLQSEDCSFGNSLPSILSDPHIPQE